MHELNIRAGAARAAVSRFRGQPLIWGKTDCLRIQAFAWRAMKQPVSLVKAGAYRTARGALKALKRTGHETLEAAIDAHGLVRIAPARARVSDVLAMPGEGALCALWLVLGNGRALGFHEDSEFCDVMAVNLGAATAAWSTYRG